jgi:alpha-mannosidase
MQPLVVDDDGDSWGADQWRYRVVVGQFAPLPEDNTIVEEGPVRTIRQSMFTWNHSSIVLKTITYSSWPVIEFRLRIHWAEARRRLKLAFPTVFKSEGILCEVPGGAITRPADGDEHSLGRWCMLEGDLKGQKVGFAVVNSGQHGLDFKDGEIRLSILRSAAYCHDKGFIISGPVARKYMDQGVHDVRLLVTVGAADAVQQSLPGLADWLSAPPIALAHLPIGVNVRGHCEFVFLEPRNVRLLATKRSEDGKALVLRLQESIGAPTKARLGFMGLRSPALLEFGPFEIKTIRFDRADRIREVDLIKEH